MKFSIAIGCDDAGIEYRNILKAQLQGDSRVLEVIDVGVISQTKIVTGEF